VTELDPAWAGIVMGAESHLVPGRLAKGSRCFGAWFGHELVGYGWLSIKPEWIGEVQLEIAPAAQEAYVWNCVTLAPHRRKGVFRSLVLTLVAKASEEGLARLWIASGGDIGQNTILNAGFVPVVHFDTATRFGLRWLKVAPVDGVDPGLATAARRAMSIKPGSSLRISRQRRH
jgi:GNAT superfamily N-acetyltransferase